MKVKNLNIHFNVWVFVISILTVLTGFVGANQELLSHILSPAQVGIVTAVTSLISIVLTQLRKKIPTTEGVTITDTTTGQTVDIKKPSDIDISTK